MDSTRRLAIGLALKDCQGVWQFADSGRGYVWDRPTYGRFFCSSTTPSVNRCVAYASIHAGRVWKTAR